MNKRLSLHESEQREYVRTYYGNSDKVSFSALGEGYGARTYFYDELDRIAAEGFPFSSDYMAKDGRSLSQQEFLALPEDERRAARLRYYYLPSAHELYIGGTGSGKTTGCVEPQLRAISKQKNKPNLFITDPKGEVFDRNAEHLVANGYKLYVLNFKDFTKSDRWNPLGELYDANFKKKTLGLGVKEAEGMPPASIDIVGKESDFSGEIYYVYDGRAFPKVGLIKKYVDMQRDIIEATVDDLINQFVNSIITVKNEKDPSWELGAQDLLRGIVHIMLEESLKPDATMTRDMMNFKTIRDIYTALKVPILADHISLMNHPLVKGKNQKVYRLLATAFHNAPSTMKSYCGVFNDVISEWFQSHILCITTGDTVKLDDEKSPFAIFVVTRDYDKSDFKIAGMFIDWVYRKMLERAEAKRTKRPLHFLLDEFGNIPKIKDFENKISTARSRNIWFHLVIQSYNQLDIVYNDNSSAVILDNCNAQIFLGSQNNKTKELFSEQCGKNHVPTMRSTLDKSYNEITEVPVVSLNNLDLISPGEMFIKRIYTPVICARFIRSYIMTENGDFPYPEARGMRNFAPFILEPYSGPKYTFQKALETV